MGLVYVSIWVYVNALYKENDLTVVHFGSVTMLSE
jgi:hypothetical protein